MKLNVGDRVRSSYDNSRTGTVRCVADTFYIIQWDNSDEYDTCPWFEHQVEKLVVKTPLTVKKAEELYYANTTIHGVGWTLKLILEYAKKHGIA